MRTYSECLVSISSVRTATADAASVVRLKPGKSHHTSLAVALLVLGDEMIDITRSSIRSAVYSSKQSVSTVSTRSLVSTVKVAIVESIFSRSKKSQTKPSSSTRPFDLRPIGTWTPRFKRKSPAYTTAAFPTSSQDTHSMVNGTTR